MERKFTWVIRTISSWYPNGEVESYNQCILTGTLLGFSNRDGQPVAMMLPDGGTRIEEVDPLDLWVAAEGDGQVPPEGATP